jgi:hypothetical protein
MVAFELYTFISEHENFPIASKFKSVINFILNYCITGFIQNIYVVDFSKRGMYTQECTNILQGLGMPMQTQEEDKEEQKKGGDKKHKLGDAHATPRRG